MYTVIAKVRKRTQQTSARVMQQDTGMAKAYKAGRQNGNVVSGHVQIGISLYDMTVQKRARI